MSDMKLFLDCDCGSPEHIARYSLWDWGTENPPELFSEIQAGHYLPWYKRVKLAFKYVFSGSGIDWHDIVLKEDDADKLINMLEEYKKLHRIYRKGATND